MFLKVTVVIALVVAALAISGCCSCCSFLSSSTDSGSNSPADGAPSDPGDADNLYGHWIWEQTTSYSDVSSGSYAGYTGMGMNVDFYKNGTFTYTGVVHNVGGGGPGYMYTGRYHADGDSIKFTKIIKYYYMDTDKPDYTKSNFADTSGTYRIVPGDAYDTIYLQADGLWNNETELYRHPS